MGTRSRLTKAIHAIGYSPFVFCEEKLGLKYSTFNYRIKNGVLTLDDIHTILRETGKSFEDIWPDPLAPARFSESETIPRLAVPIANPVAATMIAQVQRAQAKKESLKDLPLTPKEAKKGADPEMESAPAPSTFKASGLFSEISLPAEPDPE